MNLPLFEMIMILQNVYIIANMTTYKWYICIHPVYSNIQTFCGRRFGFQKDLNIGCQFSTRPGMLDNGTFATNVFSAIKAAVWQLSNHVTNYNHQCNAMIYRAVYHTRILVETKSSDSIVSESWWYLTNHCKY